MLRIQVEAQGTHVDRAMLAVVKYEHVEVLPELDSSGKRVARRTKRVVAAKKVLRDQCVLVRRLKRV